jgi:hypothetical protein
MAAQGAAEATQREERVGLVRTIMEVETDQRRFVGRDIVINGTIALIA